MHWVKQLVVVVVVALAGSTAVNAVAGDPWPTLVLGTATAVLSVLAYAWVVRRTERRAPVEVARRGAVGALVRGTMVGVGLFAAVLVVIALFGGYRVIGWGSAAGAAGTLGFMAAAAVTEELLFRGILFRFVEGRIGTWGALMLSGLLFGVAHLPNPHAGLWSALAIAVEAGGMLAAAYVATRTLWVPIGLHFGWNFAEGGIFGTAVSGKSGSQGFLDGAMSGPTLLSGGGFGPEASLPALVGGLLVTALFIRLARRRGHLVPRRSRAVAPAGTDTLAR